MAQIAHLLTCLDLTCLFMASHGDQISGEELSEAELEVYGVDWGALQEERFLHSRETNNLTD